MIREIEPALGGRTVVDTTTGDPDRTAALGERLKATGVDYLDAMIVGFEPAGPRRPCRRRWQAERPRSFNGASHLLDTFAVHEFHVGPWGSGARMKLVVNLVLGLNRAVLAEGLAFARALGFDPPWPWTCSRAARRTRG